MKQQRKVHPNPVQADTFTSSHHHTYKFLHSHLSTEYGEVCTVQTKKAHSRKVTLVKWQKLTKNRLSPWMHTLRRKNKDFQTWKYATVQICTCTHTQTRRAMGTVTFSQTPESSLMANLRENNHFSSVFEQQLGAFYVPDVKQH